MTDVTNRIVGALAQIDDYESHKLFSELVRRLSAANTDPDFDVQAKAHSLVQSRKYDDACRNITW